MLHYFLKCNIIMWHNFLQDNIPISCGPSHCNVHAVESFSETCCCRDAEEPPLPDNVLLTPSSSSLRISFFLAFPNKPEK